MEKSRLRLFFVLCLILLSTFYGIKSNFVVHAQTEGNFRLDQLNWLAARTPGATNVPLQIQLVNLHNNTITSVLGILSLSFPFSDSNDNDLNATSIGETISTYFNVSQYSVLTGDPFEFIFNLNIDINAVKGSYSANLTIVYFIIVGTELIPRSPTKFEIMLEIPNTPPVINWVRPTAALLVVDLLETVNFTVICFDNDNDSLTYSWKVDDIPISNLNRSNFLFIAQNKVGVQEVLLTVSDDETSISRTWMVETQVSSNSQLSIDTQYLKAGTTTELYLTLINNLWKGTTDIDLQDPSPLIVQGNSSWTFYNVSAGTQISFPLKIFTPMSAMGATGAAVFTVSFKDQYGTNYMEILSIGLIITGFIRVSVFNSEISSATINRGGTVLISATLLNTGNINAIFTNTSLKNDEGILIETKNSKSYLGELEPDSPLPFTLSAVINQNATIGNHLISCIVFYQDEFFTTYILSINFTITVLSASTSSKENSNFQIDEGVIGSGIAVLLGVGTIITVSYVFYRKKKK
ncbi:COG1361 S-layer family protein [Candidatus Hodarchaeum mangrovi]